MRKIGIALLMLVCWCFLGGVCLATWKSEYAELSPVVQEWFKEHSYCCLKAERVKTKFRGQGNEWEYYWNNKWQPVRPDDPEGVKAPKGMEKQALNDAQFQQLQTEGVLFLYEDMEMCFYPPQATF